MLAMRIGEMCWFSYHDYLPRKITVHLLLRKIDEDIVVAVFGARTTEDGSVITSAYASSYGINELRRDSVVTVVTDPEPLLALREMCPDLLVERVPCLT